VNADRETIGFLLTDVSVQIELTVCGFSYMSGMLASSYDVAALVVTPLISYLGGSRKKSVFCAWGLFIMGVGFFVFVLPHFISPPYEAGRYIQERIAHSLLVHMNRINVKST